MYGIRFRTGRLNVVRAAALGLVAVLGGCAALGERAETLYLRQHKVATALAETIAAIETRNPSLADTLYTAESELDLACGPLRRAGYLRLQAEPISSELEWKIVNTLDRCTRKTKQLEDLLWRINPEIAAYFLPNPATVSGHLPRLSFAPR
jgi:hypothetical protein